MPSIKFVSLISKNDKPLYIQSFEEQTPENSGEFLRYNFFSHMALDIFALPASVAIREQNNASENDPILLFIQDEISVYGFETNTNLKIVVGFIDSSVAPKLLNQIFNDIQRSYLRVICNPFTKVENDNILNSPSFDKAIRALVERVAEPATDKPITKESDLKSEPTTA